MTVYGICHSRWNCSWTYTSCLNIQLMTCTTHRGCVYNQVFRSWRFDGAVERQPLEPDGGPRPPQAKFNLIIFPYADLLLHGLGEINSSVAHLVLIAREPQSGDGRQCRQQERDVNATAMARQRWQYLILFLTFLSLSLAERTSNQAKNSLEITDPQSQHLQPSANAPASTQIPQSSL